MTDPMTSNIPTEAFVWPDTQKLVLGELSLPSDSTITTAKSLLRSLDHDNILDGLRSGNERRQNFGISHNLGDPHIVRPLSVSINGFEPSEYLQGSTKLDAPVIDTESILPGYIQEIPRRFLEAGLMKLIPGMPLDKNRPLRMAVMDTKRISTTTVREKPHLLKYMPERKVLYSILRPNITDLYTKYKDFAWASDVQLEKLSICELGLYSFKRGPLIVGQGHREIACVALPGATQSDLSAVFDDVIYTRVKPKHKVDPNAVYDVTSR